MDELVQRLSQAEQPIEISLRPERTVEAFKRRLDDGYVHVKFTQTRGGTELGVQLDPAETDFSKADFAAGHGKVSLAGELTLNYVRVRCRAEVDLSTLAGTGHLEPLES
jgi:hypothetical protein